MNIQTINKTRKTKTPSINLNWSANPSIQKLLDVVVSIMAEEYIEIVKLNPDMFCEIASAAP